MQGTTQVHVQPDYARLARSPMLTYHPLICEAVWVAPKKPPLRGIRMATVRERMSRRFHPAMMPAVRSAAMEKLVVKHNAVLTLFRPATS